MRFWCLEKLCNKREAGPKCQNKWKRVFSLHTREDARELLRAKRLNCPEVQWRIHPHYRRNYRNQPLLRIWHRMEP